MQYGTMSEKTTIGLRSATLAVGQVSPTRRLCKRRLGIASLVVLFSILAVLSFSSDKEYKNMFEGQVEDRQVSRDANRDGRDRILAFSLYGDDPRYIRGAVANAGLVQWTYPGWLMRVYHDNSVDARTLAEVTSNGHVQLVNMTGSELNPKNWRFLPAVDTSVEVFCSRDVDSRLTRREFSAVSQWLYTDAKVHMIRDHPGHRGEYMLAGMWCAKAGAIPNLIELLNAYHKEVHFSADQEFLRDQVWPQVHSVMLQHASFGCEVWNGTLPIPMARIGLEHIGAVFIDGEMRQNDMNILRNALKNGEECV